MTTKPPFTVRIGVYRFLVVKAQEAISKRSGQPMIAITMKISSAGYDYIVTDYMTGSYIERVREFLLASGKTELMSNDSLEPDDFLGCSGLVKIGIQNWEGRARPKIINYLPTTQEKKCHN